MSPDECIAALDGALSVAGGDVILRRVVGEANPQMIDVTCRANVRFGASKDIAGEATQATIEIIMSPTQINQKQWPGGTPASTARFQTDPGIPRTSDVIFVQGRQRTILAVRPFAPQGVVVRIELTVAG